MNKKDVKLPVYQDPKNKILLEGLELFMSNNSNSAAELLQLVEATEEKEKRNSKRSNSRAPAGELPLLPH